VQRIPGSEATNGATWSADDVGDLTGRVALVTGANSGIGYETARVLAAHGAHVIMACRSHEKAARARDKLESQLRRSSLELLDLDLADLASVRGAAERVVDQHARLDLLVNNAGVMGTPHRRSPDGFEVQMATNHLGHFALTGLLLDRLVTTERSRIVAVSSNMHHLGRLHPDDVATTKARNSWIVYSTTKLANLLFVDELSRRLDAGGFRTMALAAHPGWTRSNLAGNGAALSESRVRRRLSRAVGSNMGQPAAGGALPVLCAATSSSVHNGQYLGPAGFFGLFGPPRVARPSRRARDVKMAARLWAESEKLTGVRYSVGATV
jgi:NAD(P)-dependent dehydrogenase (short-subunit alcohol dehydrogenase family)